MRNDECGMRNDLSALREAAQSAREGRDECLRKLMPMVRELRDDVLVERFAALRGFVRELDILRKQELELVECGKVSAECGVRNAECGVVNDECAMGGAAKCDA